MPLVSQDIQALLDAFKPQFDVINKRFDGMDKRIDITDKRFNDLQAHMDTKFQDIQDNLEMSLRAVVEEIYGNGSVSQEVESLKKRVFSHRR